jgi:hypothetical protein
MTTSMTTLHCIVCGNTLPPSAREGETAGPLLCERHTMDEPRMAGVLGFPNLDHHPPLEAIAASVQGHRIVRARQVADPMNVVLELDGAGVLILFCSVFEAYVQYIPWPAVDRGALDELPDLATCSPPSRGPGATAVLAAIRAGIPLASIDIGRFNDDSPARHLLEMKFAGGFELGLECAGFSPFDEPSPGLEFVLFWYNDREPS